MNLIIKIKALPKNPNRVKPAQNSMKVKVEPSQGAKPQLERMRALKTCLVMMFQLEEILKGEPNYKVRWSSANAKEEDESSFYLTYPTEKLEEAKELIMREASKAGVWNKR